jgi:hypothetical protein
MSWIRYFDTRRLVVVITFMAIFAMAARISVDTDTWWHLRAGQWIWDHQAVLRVDPFSYTRAGANWQYPGWLVEPPLYWIYRLFGPGGLNLWTAGMVTLAFAFVWRTLSGGPFLRAFVMVLAAAASGVYWAARPYLVTFVLAAVFLWILEDYRRKGFPSGSKSIWWIPLLMVIWANSHGGFAVGFILLGVYFMGSFGFVIKGSRVGLNYSRTALRALLSILLTSVLAVCINPFGPVMLLYPFKTVNIGVLQDYIQEWQSPDFHSISVQPFAWLLLLTLAIVGVSRRRVSLIDLMLTAGFAYLGLLAGRNVALFALVAPMVITRHTAPMLAAISRGFRIKSMPVGVVPGRLALINLLIACLVLITVGFKVALVYPRMVNEQAFQKGLPVEAVEYLRQTRPPGRLFNSYNWGAYLLWALPEYPVFVDGRTDLYNDEVIGEWLRVARAEDGWQEILDKWGVRLVLVEPKTPLVYRLEDNGWQVLYSDQVSVVYGRR